MYAKRNCSVSYDNKKVFTIDSETISTESIGNELKFGHHKIHFYHTPGHTDASICIAANRSLFTRDLLIKNEKTVTKLPTGSVDKLRESMIILAVMQGKGYKVFPSHGAVFELDEYDLRMSWRRIK